MAIYSGPKFVTGYPIGTPRGQTCTIKNITFVTPLAKGNNLQPNLKASVPKTNGDNNHSPFWTNLAFTCKINFFLFSYSKASDANTVLALLLISSSL